MAKSGHVERKRKPESLPNHRENPREVVLETQQMQHLINTPPGAEQTKNLSSTEMLQALVDTFPPADAAIVDNRMIHGGSREQV